MPTVKRSDFVTSLNGKSLDVATAQGDSRLANAQVQRADLDGNGRIEGTAEATELFKRVDVFDRDGNASTVNSTGQVAQMLAAIAELARPTASGPRDTALGRAFPTGLSAPITRGASGTQVLAVQYTLGRLGLFNALANGSYGPVTEDAVKRFQASASLPSTGVLDQATLDALDAAVTTRDLRTPAARETNPIAYLSDFNARGLTPVTVSDRSQPVGWKHPEIQAAYGKFVGEYWQVLKENHVECDCKTLALFFMDQFRKKVKADLNVQLPSPRTARGSLLVLNWTSHTAARPGGFFSRFESLPVIRAGYSNAIEIQKLDAKHSMIYGVNVRAAGVNADGAARAATEIAPWNPALEGGSDDTRPEVDVQKLQPGDIVFIDHTGDNKVDHTVNVVAVQKDGQGRVTSLTLAVGSFDDMKDADGSTAPALNEVNNYTEEVTVALNTEGRVTSSAVTWSSEPGYVSRNRYSAATTLMELRPGGTLKVSRWM